MHLLSIYRTVYLSFRDLRVHQHLTRYNFLFVWGGQGGETNTNPKISETDV